MSTIQGPRAEPTPGSEADPFRYGWRYLPRKQADGRVQLEQVPLTLEDLLFPEEGDFALQSPSHVNDCLFLKMIFGSRLAGDPEALVLYDCRVDWNLPGVRPLGPDIAVLLGVPRDFDLETLGLAEEDATPVLVVEVTSPETRKNDFGIKKDLYHRAGMPLYVIVDARPGPKGRRVKLHGFRHVPGGYESVPLDDEGRLWIGPLALWLASVDGRVACIDGESGEPIGGYEDQVQARIEAVAHAEALSHLVDQAKAHAETEIWNRMMFQARAEVEARIRVAAEARVADAEARIESQDRLIAAQAHIIELNDQIRDAQKAKLDELEARMPEMEAELRRLRGEG